MTKRATRVPLEMLSGRAAVPRRTTHLQTLSYQQEAAVSADGRLALVAYQMTRFFGTTDAENAPWISSRSPPGSTAT